MMRRRPAASGDDAPSESVTGSTSATAPTSSQSSGTSGSTRRGSLQAKNEERQIDEMIQNLAAKSPPWLADFLRSLAPMMKVFYQFVNFAGPHVIQFSSYVIKTWELLPKNVIGMIYGLVMCFFGGFFHVTIAAIEAFNMTGGDKIQRCIENLKIDLENVAKANEADDKQDNDGDGTSDVVQMSGEKLVTRKLALILRVVDPVRVTNALTGLWEGYMGILIVLRFQFAKVVTLAVSIGNQLRPIMARFVAPSLVHVIPPEYHKWIDPLINFTCKFVAMSLAWYVQRLISTVQSAIRGGLLFSRSLITLIGENTSMNIDADNTILDEVVGWSLAIFGAYFQISSGWDLPWFVDILLWPAYLLEYFLEWSVTWMDTTPDMP